MKKVLTIGFHMKSLRKFAEMLRGAAVDVVIDVRFNNTSQLAGYTKRDDLQYILQLLGISYEHHLELAPTDELFKAYRNYKNFDEYEQRFAELIIERDMASVGRQILDCYSRPCLLCAEETPEQCHRRLIAEEWERNIPDLEIEHLV